MASIRSAELKADRAKIHLDSLKARIKWFVENEAKQPSTEDDLKSGEYVITLPSSDGPLECALLYGDFICCLRAALDHLAYALASISGKASRDTFFPIRHEYTVEATIAIAKATFGMSEEAITLIRHLQPHGDGDDYRLKHLWRLNKLWNIDKHRFIAMHSTVVDWTIPITLTQPNSVRRIGDDSVEMRFPLAVKDQMHLYPRPTIDIQFGHEEEGIVVTKADLTAMYEYVADGVLPMFKSFFL